jgi:ABC-type dipeptide/oligopeptide/nickel transport system permease subunit
VVEHAIIGDMVRLALALWIAWAVLVWNVVFDHVIVLAGREYIQAALATGAGPFANMDDWMRPAARRGAWYASGASGAILLIGVSLCALRRTR